jgi:hypothetical protein
MSEGELAAPLDFWAKQIAKVIRQAEEDGCQISISYDQILTVWDRRGAKYGFREVEW